MERLGLADHPHGVGQRPRHRRQVSMATAGEEQHEVRGRHLGCVTLKNDRRQPAVTACHRPGRLATTQVPAASAARHLHGVAQPAAASGGGSPMARLAYLLEV
jgi:hypothetical protein